MIRYLVLVALLALSVSAQRCAVSSITTASGSAAPSGQICPGDLIFEDNFDWFNDGHWDRDNTLSGGGNGEFQWYSWDNENLYTDGGHLIVNPTLMADRFGEGVLTGGEFSVWNFGTCTDDRSNGCARYGSPGNIINPVISGKMHSRNHFNFKYGTIQFRARLPAGDWLWPAVWMMPKDSIYGGWPNSGEIDLVEGRGNRNLWNGGTHIGSQQVSSTLHSSGGWQSRSWNNAGGFVDDFHEYTLYWGTDFMDVWVDGVKQTFYDTAHPFDQEFYFIVNVAVAGTNGYFPDGIEGKPWWNGAQYPMTDFWNNRNQWLPTWDWWQRRMEIDFIRVWARRSDTVVVLTINDVD